MNKEGDFFNSVKFQLTFIKQTGLSISIVGSLLILWKVSLYFLYYTEISYSKYSFSILLFGITYFLLGLFIYLKKELFLKYVNALSSIFVLNLVYLFLELSLYFISGFSNVDLNPSKDKRTILFNQPSFHYDEIRGYRWIKNNSRQVLLSPDNTVIWDNKIKCNNVGYISKQDYSFKKKNKGTKRYIVLGDSFSSAEFNEQSWVDYAQDYLKETNIELYSFSLSGIGLQNWHNIYFKEIIAKYEFDGIIFAFLSSDWQRPFTIFHTDDRNNMLIGGFDSPPLNSKTFNTDFLHKMTVKKKWSIASDAEINQKINTSSYYSLEVPTLNIIELFYYKIVIKLKKITASNTKNKLNISDKLSPKENLINTQGKRKFELINSIITDCKKKDKEVILCSIPFKEEVFQFKKNNAITNDRSMENLAEIYNINYFNGYRIFSLKSKEVIISYYYKEDRHWNDTGSKNFAYSFSKYLNSIN